MKIRHYIYITLTAMLAVACSDDTDSGMSFHGELIGQGVRFHTSIAEPFTTRTTYRHDGSFNEGDLMTIYRQYATDAAGTSFYTDNAHLTYRVYQFDTKYATGTSIALETDWKPKVGATGCTNGTTFTQTAGDSLTWEDGRTVRFRAWSRSNLSGALGGGRGSYYPDYCVSGWVTVAGPTLDIPLSLKHQGCRIGFIQKNGNVLYKAEICTTTEDYMWEDNSTDDEADAADKWADAATKAAEVKAVYDKMCMPAGVDINTSLLKTMTQTLYNAETTSFPTIHTLAGDGIVEFGTKTPQAIKDEVQRPVFSSNLNNRLYMITIPYDMSNATTQGEVLKLPAFTRFRIYIYDVNNGDKGQTTDYEAKYHIFSLSDIKKTDSDEALFPEGLELTAGNSYQFSVGYHYDKLTITPADNFSWVAQDAEDGAAADATVAEQTPEKKLGWWKNGISVEIDSVKDDENQKYSPVFHIKTAEEFKELIELVNGSLLTQNAIDGKLVQVTDPYQTFDDENPPGDDDYRWYSKDYISNGKVMNDHKSDSTTHDDAIAAGYIFYQRYHSANADQKAYAREDYLRAPYSFFDEDLNRHFTIYLDNNLDLHDWKLTSIGTEDYVDATNKGKTFRGIFNGQNYTISNIYMTEGYMFKYCMDVTILNLNIETTHNFMLIKTSKPWDAKTGYGADFMGISIKAPSSGNPFAESVTGSTFMVGCFYEGKAGGAMIGTADNLYMYGNMVAATGLTKETGALLGAYAYSNKKFLAPQTAKTKSWGRFMVNYYDITKSPTATAVGGIDDAYSPQEYIRGAESHILKAKNDNMLAGDVAYSLLTSDLMRRGYYGLAPWKALNYAIWKYIQENEDVNKVSPCNVHFVTNSDGYGHTYPKLEKGAPGSNLDLTGYKDSYESLDVLKQNN